MLKAEEKMEEDDEIEKHKIQDSLEAKLVMGFEVYKLESQY